MLTSFFLNFFGVFSKVLTFHCGSFHPFYLDLPYVLAESAPFLFVLISSKITEDIELLESVPVTKITENSSNPSEQTDQ